MSLIYAVWANYVSTWTEKKLQMQLLCHLSCQGWTTATVVCGACQRSSYWDYSESSNSGLWGMPKKQLLRLQRVQKTAARTVTETKRLDHITPILRDLHWLPVDLVSCVQLYEWHSPPVPSGTNTPLPSSASSAVLHPITSSHPKCRPRKNFFWGD